MTGQTLAEPVTTDTFPINGTDFVELFVGNARQSALYYETAFGFRRIAYRGPETGSREVASYVLEQGKIRLVLSTALDPDHPVARSVLAHGDGVHDIALWVDDARAAFAKAVARGALPAREPVVLRDGDGEAVVAGIRTYGETVHSLVERRGYRGVFLPGYVPLASRYQSPPAGLEHIDHCVGNVELGKMNHWVAFYRDVLGFSQIIGFDDKDISTEYSALMSKVMANGNGRIKFPINEPAQGRKKSQIEEYLDYYHSPGVQHLALASTDIIRTVTRLRDHGVEFLRVPENYYDTVLDRVGRIDEALAPLAELGILVDRDDEGYLLQIFTRPVQDRPTLFYEIIQRKGAKSFGKGNFKALFEAIEREQAARGNL